MKPRLIISVSSVQDLISAEKYEPDLIEIRIDLLEEEEEEMLKICDDNFPLPLIGTIRSCSEGGAFEGTPDEWYERIKPWIYLCNYIDLERDISHFSNTIKRMGKKIISSVHLDYMPGEAELSLLEKNLRDSGDIPKIIITPKSPDDVLALSGFTLACPKPVITGVMGDKFRWARALCCLFGSFGVFCHSGNPASEGQYHIDEMKEILSLLN